MNDLLMIGLAIATVITARSLWKVDQVFSISVLLMALIALVWLFTLTSGLGQVILGGLALGLYQCYTSKAISALHTTVSTHQ